MAEKLHIALHDSHITIEEAERSDPLDEIINGDAAFSRWRLSKAAFRELAENLRNGLIDTIYASIEYDKKQGRR